MKNRNPVYAFLSVTLLGMATACSSMGGTSSQDIAQTGPTIVSTKAEPGTFELNKQLQATNPAQVIAEVKDFHNNVTDVKLRFTHVPLELPMKQINASTWQAELSQQQLKQLAVSGHTMKYEANVIATNDKGQVAVSKEPVKIEVKAPEVATG